MKEKIRQTILDTIEEYRGEASVSLERLTGLESTLWREPVTGFVSASDGEFFDIRKHSNPEHLFPEDMLAGARSVVCFFIPFTKDIVHTNRMPGPASEAWALAYIHTNTLIQKINVACAEVLLKNGFRTGQIPATHNFDTQKLVSGWSHRHVAYIARLGTFGLNNMLITDKGCCGRLGSFVTDCPIDPDAKTVPVERCLFKADGSCGLCLKRCETAALSAAQSAGAFDRHGCYERCLENAGLYEKHGLADVCGKCLADLPCSFGSPVR